ncbi:hypothetical protein B0H13DRAFT_2303644 [Mycena leptocephala]|nr:hypothetical protein B0H13DRAFT_2303644 [Mycena leptocephala]
MFSWFVPVNDSTNLIDDNHGSEFNHRRREIVNTDSCIFSSVGDATQTMEPPKSVTSIGQTLLCAPRPTYLLRKTSTVVFTPTVPTSRASARGQRLNNVNIPINEKLSVHGNAGVGHNAFGSHEEAAISFQMPINDKLSVRGHAGVGNNAFGSHQEAAIAFQMPISDKLSVHGNPVVGQKAFGWHEEAAIAFQMPLNDKLSVHGNAGVKRSSG